jgi:SAM-dependent methyltransferase
MPSNRAVFPLPTGQPIHSLATDFDIPKSSYDIAVLLNVAEHLDQPQELFQAILKLLKPGGVILLTCPYGNSLARRFHQSQWGHLALDEHLLFWNPYSLTYLLREIGFQGKFSYRISGSPFPYGRVKNIANQAINLEQNNHSYKQVSIQGRVWNLARYIQKHEAIANLVRSLVHITHTGDYLEYAICVSRSH